jgi:hypothetical protein
VNTLNQAKRLMRRCLERVPCQWRFTGTCDDAELDRGASHSVVVSHARAASFQAPLNVTASELSEEITKQGYSRAQVLDRRLDGLKSHRLPRVSIIEWADQYENGFYALFRPGRRKLNVSGTGWIPEHLETLRESRFDTQELEAGSWFFECWSGNYFHWMTRCLPKAIILADMYPNDPLLVPSRLKRNRFLTESLKRAGLYDRVLQLRSPRVLVRELNVLVGMGTMNEYALRVVRERLSAPQSSQQSAMGARIFVSRAGASWRKLLNENEVRDRLRELSFEVVDFGKLSFAEQIEVSAHASILVGVHGAGLTNMLFARPGLQVVEIEETGFPNPDYYLLASCLGHDYWLVSSASSSTKAAGYKDITVDSAELIAIVERAAERYANANVN